MRTCPICDEPLPPDHGVEVRVSSLPADEIDHWEKAEHMFTLCVKCACDLAEGVAREMAERAGNE